MIPMEKITPNPIKKYYIAYFDILGYKDFFKSNPNKAGELLHILNQAITSSLEVIKSINESILVSQFANMDVEHRIFSDNILLTLEVGVDEEKERTRIYAFFVMICEIQRSFILEYGLFVRGALTVGELSVNNEYVFGNGLIEAVDMEETTVYPRIAISNDMLALLEVKASYTNEEYEKAIMLEKQYNDSVDISLQDRDFLSKIQKLAFRYYFEKMLFNFLIYPSADGVKCLSYLYVFDVHSFISEKDISQVTELMGKIYPKDSVRLSKQSPDIGKVLDCHKKRIEYNLIRYSDYSSIDIQNIVGFDRQERVLKKYIWSMVYHNRMCQFYNKLDYYINTQANCENRHMKMMINVLGTREE